MVVSGMCTLQPRRPKGKSFHSGKFTIPGSIEAALLTCDSTNYLCETLSASTESLEVYMPLCHKREEHAVLDNRLRSHEPAFETGFDCPPRSRAGRGHPRLRGLPS